MAHLEIVLLGMLVAVAGLLVLSSVVRVPYPILLVVGGLAIGFVPGLPRIELPPELVLVIVLPPLLYSAAFFSSLRDLRANVRPIGLLAVGLVVATMVGVAVAAHSIVPGLGWPAAFVLGAVVSPTDPVAATAIARRLGVPRRIVTIVEGESLINDGTALVAYGFAVAAATGAAVSVWDVAGTFVVSVVGGVVVGLLVGWAVAWVRRPLENHLLEITISLCTPYFAYLPAEELHVSGVLAAVTSGIYLGWHSPGLISAATRLRSFAVWEVLVFALNSVLFVLVGLQLPGIVEGFRDESPLGLALYGLGVSLSVVAIRVVWVFVFTYVPRRLSRRLRERDPAPSWRATFVVAWSGMRGAVSLAAALAIPAVTLGGEPFPQRELVIFLSFSVILVTLVGQGLSLPLVVRALDVRADDGEEREEIKARLHAAKAAIRRLDELGSEEWVRDETAERLHGIYDYRRRRFAARVGDDDGHEDYEERSAAFVRLRRALLDAEREAILRLRRERRISDEVMRRVERDLDLEEERL
jgi:CPA1 family monovalent cation:H+ antiporter